VPLLGSMYRALDLTNEKGLVCGKILGDLGVDVIKIENPGGDGSRNIGPFYRDDPHPERSLLWFAYNTNKRSITLNIETRDGQQILKRLIKSAHFIIESFPPGYMDRLGIGYPVLSVVNPRIIMTSITPFGQNGPYKDYKTSDIVATAMGGYLHVNGDRDRPPVRVSFDQIYPLAGVVATVGTMVAHYHREITGEGQHVDVSLQASLVWHFMCGRFWWDFNRVRLERSGPYQTWGMAHVQRGIWPCKDGYITFIIQGGSAGARTNRALLEWMDSEGVAPDYLKKMDWDAIDMGEVSKEDMERYEQAFGRFFLTHTKKEIAEEAFRRGISLGPVNTTSELIEDPQLKSRNFWVEVEYPELGATISHPRGFVNIVGRPSTIRRAPLIGEHNKEIYKDELGFSSEELAILKQGNVI
jgi:crotonobetainyl-CoA:carnitine CoA-transferase CaiB-like acyl-CoA transferase